MTNSTKNAVKLFYSYSHKDEEIRNELEKHLSILKRQNAISEWHDRKILGGEEWEKEINQELQSASIILLLVSSDFLASDYCYGKELEMAMKRHEEGDARVIPIIIRSVDWEGAPFGKLQALPKDAKAVNSWNDRDEAFTNIAQGIRSSIAQIKRKAEPKETTSDISELKTILTASGTYEDWQAIGKYKIKDGIAVDTKAKLMWLRFAYGEEWTNCTWQNDTVIGKATEIDVKQLPKIIEQFNTRGYGGFCDWRLPSIDELRTLIEKNNSQGQFVDRDVFPENTLNYWSSTENPNHYGVANQFIDTFNGEIGRFDTCGCSCAVRLVRSI